MTPERLAELEAEAESILDYSHAPSTRAGYRNSIVRFLLWLIVNNRQLILDSFYDSLELDGDGIPKVSSIQLSLSTAPVNPPIDFARLKPKNFMTWIMSMKTSDDKFFAYSTYKNHRSAFGFLFSTYDVCMDTAFRTEMAKSMSALKKRIARQISAGDGKIKVGKDPLPFSLYRRICLEMLRSPSRDMVFARTFMILSWNLMSRAANTVSICYRHMEWGEDALSIYFAHMKNDQTGSRPRDPRHLYANPLMPEVCPILALGVYWAVYGVDEGDGALFPGSNQYDRFRKILGRVLAIPDIAEELEQRGIDPTNFGTHSMRKGAATYCSSGSTACPSSIAIHLRAGWAMGGVTDRYLRHAAAGDMHVGRTVCGLPTEQPEFAALPPRFIGARNVVSEARSLCFPRLPACAVGIGEFALASLVVHLPFLRGQIPGSHPLLQNILLRNELLINQLAAVLATADDTDIAPTGIPPHVALLLKMRAVENALRDQQEAQAAAAVNQQRADNALVERILAGVSNIIEERAVASGVPTCDRLAASVLQYFRDAGFFPSQSSHDQCQDGEAQSAEANRDDGTQARTVYTWGGGLHTFPEGPVLPTGTPEQAWVLWSCGDQSRNTPPLALLEPQDVSVARERKRLCDLRFLMGRIETRARSIGVPTHDLSAAEALDVYARCADAITLTANTQSGRKRRRGQLVWITVATELRKAARRTNNTASEDRMPAST